MYNFKMIFLYIQMIITTTLFTIFICCFIISLLNVMFLNAFAFCGSNFVVY